jgi:transcriptional regulator with XRE-family HTH domain
MNKGKEELLKQLGRNIKAERVRKGYSQEVFAEILDVHPSYIGKIESGKQNMSIGKILELATALNIHINDLLKFN